MGKEKNVFISHQNQDDEHIKKFKDLLSSKGYTIKNSSVDSSKWNKATNEDYIKRLLRMRIQWAGTTIVLVGSDTHSSKWVDWEIKQAHQKGKRILGVFVRGAKDSDVPESLNRYGHGLVGWNSDKIIDGLEGKEVGWCNSEGKERTPEHVLVRVAC